MYDWKRRATTMEDDSLPAVTIVADEHVVIGVVVDSVLHFQLVPTVAISVPSGDPWVAGYLEQ
jgi:hypothetical protein